ncbi:hypothetical protein EASAB2608_03282 [Streptomyces sp. EAS-AB2608]|nr:hypothetical protein EASAB2608_03282 [Streptomyces sp. EAS-AB2608]
MLQAEGRAAAGGYQAGGEDGEEDATRDAEAYRGGHRSLLGCERPVVPALTAPPARPAHQRSGPYG